MWSKHRLLCCLPSGSCWAKRWWTSNRFELHGCVNRSAFTAKWLLSRTADRVSSLFLEPWKSGVLPASFTCAPGSLSAQLRLYVTAADGSYVSGWRFGESRLNLLLCEAERRNFNWVKQPKCPKQVDQRNSCSEHQSQSCSFLLRISLVT